MRIKEFWITHYGPLPDRGKTALSDFNLIYGANETGKTLTLEALIKLLLGKNVKDFKNINRVNQEVDGYIIIKTEEEEKKLGRKIHLDDIFPVTAGECRNIFVIRNSDLSIESEASFYTEVTNRLTGLQTNRINKLREKILEFSELTPGGDFSNRKEDGHLKTRIEDSFTLLEDIKSLKREIEEEGLEKLEREWIRLFDEIKTKEILRSKFEEARKRLAYERAATALSKIDSCKKDLEDLSAFSEEDFIKWRDAEREIKRIGIKFIEINKALKESETRIKTIEDDLKEKENEFRIKKNKKEKIDILRSRLADLKNRKIETSSERTFTLVNQQSFFVVSILLAISILGLILNQTLVFTILAGVFGVCFFVFMGLLLKSKKSKALFEKHLEALRIDLTGLGIKGETIEDFLGEVEMFSLKFGEKEGEINMKKVELGTLKNRIAELKEKTIPELNEKTENNNDFIRKIKSDTFVESLKEFSENLEKKERLGREVEKEERVLEEILGTGDRTEKIRDLKAFAEKAKDVEFNEKDYAVLSKEISSAREKLGESEGKLNILSERFKEIEKKANNILEEKDLRCHGVRDLNNIETKVRTFIEGKEFAKEDAIVSLGILEEIAEEEKTKIREQFGEESAVSEYFSKITGGLYTSVIFEEKEEKIMVVRKDEAILYPWQLSGGTYDQLYLSIRLALGEKILGGEKGFFILDDPFVKASHNRLKVLIRMLKDISKSGWQIIYISAKEEIKETLGKDDEVKLIELESIL
ncbi:AAA family ATPase [candidate division WOR-3 bacterium]|nr:AAA family ATPase [candidate division WOR-3 bacterium]